jgi:hypothetical protein
VSEERCPPGTAAGLACTKFRQAPLADHRAGPTHSGEVASSTHLPFVEDVVSSLWKCPLAQCGRHLVPYSDVASEQQWQLLHGGPIAYVVASGLEV